MKDAQIFDAVAKGADSLAALKALGLRDSAVRKYGKYILGQLGAELDATEVIASEKPLTKAQRETVKVLKAYVAGVAESLHIAPELLVKKADYQAAARSGNAASDPPKYLVERSSGLAFSSV